MSNNDTSYNENHTDLLYTRPQTAALELIPYFVAPLSLGGSSLILWSLWCGRQDPQQHSVYHRLILGISALDTVTSLTYLGLGSWVVPEFVTFTLYGRGTFQTCEVSAFFANFVFGTMWYSSFLAIYFYLLVRWEWSDETMARTLEPVAHFVSVLYPLVTGIVGLADNLFNPLRHLPGSCWFMDFPPDCSDASDAPDCIRGAEYGHVAVVTDAVAPLFLLIVIAIAMASIVIRVRHTEGKLRAYASGQRSTLHRTRETAGQAILYIASFFAVYFPMIVLNWIAEFGRGDLGDHANVLFVFALLERIFTPLQGFFNAFIYLRKRFWKFTLEGQRFGFLRKLPLLGGPIVRVSEKRNNAPLHSHTTTTTSRTAQQSTATTRRTSSSAKTTSHTSTE